jgi:hypothetical protein
MNLDEVVQVRTCKVSEFYQLLFRDNIHSINCFDNFSLDFLLEAYIALDERWEIGDTATEISLHVFLPGANLE